jgi:hypothetical protein
MQRVAPVQIVGCAALASSEAVFRAFVKYLGRTAAPVNLTSESVKP